MIFVGDAEDLKRGVSADHMLVVWDLIERITAHPGYSRKELAKFYGYSERQMQANLNMIRQDMGFPLVRRQGYRFVDCEQHPTLSLEHATTLLMLVWTPTCGVSQERVHSLMAALPSMVPPHLQPLIRVALLPGQKQIFATLIHAAMAKQFVRLCYDGYKNEVYPQVIFPHRRRWRMVGTDRKGKRAVFDLGRVLHVEELAS